MISRINVFLKTTLGRKVEHLVVTFFSTFGITLLFNGEHLLNDHGLSAWKSTIPALFVTAAMAGWQTVRPGISSVLDGSAKTPAPPTAVPPAK